MEPSTSESSQAGTAPAAGRASASAAGPAPASGAEPAPAPPPAPQTYRFEFDAQGGEYFRIWIVNLLLTIATLGIYSAWAKVRKLRYLHGHTRLAGSVFGYHAEPLRILRGRLIAAAIGAAYFGATRVSPFATLGVVLLIAIAMPWLVVRSRMFTLNVTSWRGLRFGFAPDYAGAYRALLGWPLLSMLTLGILYPWAVRQRFHYVLSRSRYGRTAVECNPPLGRYYKTAFVTFGVVIAALVVIGVAAVVMAVFFRPTNINAGPTRVAFRLLGLAGYLVIFVVLQGYTQSRNVNAALGSSGIGPAKLHCRLKARRLMGLYLTNLLAVVATVGLAVPWAQLRLLRYRLQALELESAEPLEGFVAANESAMPGAAGEEITGLFDVDFGF